MFRSILIYGTSQDQREIQMGLLTVAKQAVVQTVVLTMAMAMATLTGVKALPAVACGTHVARIGTIIAYATTGRITNTFGRIHGIIFGQAGGTITTVKMAMSVVIPTSHLFLLALYQESL
jgi:hypothetical protein